MKKDRAAEFESRFQSFASLGGPAHGAERTTRDVDILLTPDGFERFRQEFVGDVYEQVEGRPRPCLQVVCR